MIWPQAWDNQQWEEPMVEAKSYEISKWDVVRAWEMVKANRGVAGVDGKSIEDFEENLKGNLYKIWNRMSSGSYLPPPVLSVEIPKGDGKTRPLGIPTVSDRVAQQVVKQQLEPLLEPHFHPDSYAYRTGRSALDAVATTRKRCWRQSWVIDLDIKGFFDNLDHDLVMRAVRHHTTNPWILLYVERWLKAPAQNKRGVLSERTKGTPQGGVISPLLANLFMHYAFDTWMMRAYPGVLFARYADDVIVHAASKKEAEEMLAAIRERLRECHLEVHPEKTKTDPWIMRTRHLISWDTPFGHVVLRIVGGKCLSVSFRQSARKPARKSGIRSADGK